MRPQRQGRWDNSEHYDSWYLALTPTGAIAESFGSRALWKPSTFLTPAGNARALATFEIADDTLLFDLDDSPHLVDLGRKPSEIVRRNLPVTQEVALQIYERTRGDFTPVAGLKWWSSQLPAEDVLMVWSAVGSPAPMKLVDVRDLSVSDPDVILTADMLRRVVELV
jgi:hypothetical protein